MQSATIGLLVLAICVVLFLTKWIPSSAAAVLGCLLLVLTRACSFETAFSGFSNSIVLLMTGSMIVGIAMFRTGLAGIIGRFVIRVSSGREFTFLITSCLLAGGLAMFLANTAILAAFIPIIESICLSSSEMKRKNLLLPLAYSVMVGGACTLIGCTPQLTANGMMKEMVGLEMGMWTMTRPALCIFALYMVYLVLFGYQHGNRIWGNREETDFGISQEQLEKVTEQKVKKRRLVFMIIIVSLMMVSYAFAILPAALTAICAAMLCVICRCCSVKRIIQELNWETVVFLAGCLGLASGITEAGTGEMLGNFFEKILGYASISSPFLLFAFMVVFSMLISQFVTNSTAIVIMLPIALTICSRFGYNPMSFCVGITLAASLACCTPLAAAQITMTEVAGYEFKDYLRYGWIPSLVFLAGILITVPLFMPLA